MARMEKKKKIANQDLFLSSPSSVSDPVFHQSDYRDCWNRPTDCPEYLQACERPELS